MSGSTFFCCCRFEKTSSLVTNATHKFMDNAIDLTFYSIFFNTTVILYDMLVATIQLIN